MATTLSKAFDIGRVKGIIAASWYIERLKFGVLLFTGIFVVFNVALVNVIGLLLGLALDTKLKTRNVLRSIFFI